ncbi:MAG: CDGSH iron-sulfur domain-containing protein [Chloroflexi bacterium]|nr:CDGSH iron-sulfur domain-containing protein [Chloroflexota bacterium]
MADVTITPRRNGPYLIQGPIKLVDPEGKEYTLQGDVIALCRCGGSSNKPFCDGTHRQNGFQHEPAAH